MGDPLTAARVLVVEDDDVIGAALESTLRQNGYQALWVRTGRSAVRAATAEEFDLVLLDLGLPDLDGVEVIRGIRGWSQAPIIVLSARERELDKVAALDAGADDYVTKPFGMDELLARLRAATRRATSTARDEPVVSTAHFTVDLGAKQVTDHAGGEVRLTPTEWEIVELLVRNDGRLVASRQILTQVWGEGYQAETHYLRVYLAQIRRKLEPDSSRPRYFHTEPGMGYRFVSSQAADQLQ
ncbi:MAG TPA: response regulator [Mycobacteriales bacterium]